MKITKIIIINRDFCWEREGKGKKKKHLKGEKEEQKITVRTKITVTAKKESGFIFRYSII